MMDLRKLWRRMRAQERIGCDFGGDAFKLVQLGRRGNALYLKQHGVTTVDWLSNPDLALHQVEDFFQQRSLVRRNIAMNVPEGELLIRPMELGKMPDRDLAMAVRWNFRDAIQGPLEHFRVAYTKVGEPDEHGRQRYVAYGISGTAVERQKAMAQQMALHLAAIEPDVSALMAAMAHNLYWEPGQRLALFDLGYRKSHVLIACDGQLIFASILPGASLSHLADALVAAADQSARREALMAIMRGEDQTEATREAVANFYSQVLLEVDRAVDQFASQQGLEIGQGIQRLFLSGGGALLPDIDKHLATNLGVETDLFNPFRQVEGGEGGPATVMNAPQYAVAMGLAIPVE